MVTGSERCVLITGHSLAAPKKLFFANIKKVLTPNIQFDVIERDFRAVDYTGINGPMSRSTGTTTTKRGKGSNLLDD